MSTELQAFPPNHHVALAPWAWFDLSSSAGSDSFEYVAGIHRDVLRSLCEASAGLRSEIEAVLGDVWAGRIAADDPRLPVLLEDAYAELVAMHPRFQAHITARREPDGSFTWDYPLDPDYRSTRRLDHFRAVNARARQVREGDLKSIDGRDIAWLAGQLDGRLTLEQLRTRIAARGGAAANALPRVLATLAGMQALVHAPSNSVQQHWLSHTRSGDMVHLGHAALAYRAGDDFLMFDPWLMPWYSTGPNPSVWPTVLPRPAALFYTHEHDDHFSERTLTAFPKDTPVIVPAPAEGVFYDFRTHLEHLGFSNIVELGHGQRFDIDGGFVEAVPFYGEDPCDLKLSRNCYLVVHNGRRTLVWADSGPANDGTSPLSDGVVDDLVERYGPVHLMLTSQQQLMEIRVLSVYAGLTPPGSWFQSGENGFLTNDYLAEVCRRAGVRQLVSYATGGASWLPDKFNFVFTDRNQARTALTTASWARMESLARLLAEQGCGYHAAWALDIYRARPDGGTDILPAGDVLDPARVFALDHG